MIPVPEQYFLKSSSGEVPEIPAMDPAPSLDSRNFKLFLADDLWLDEDHRNGLLQIFQELILETKLSEDDKDPPAIDGLAAAPSPLFQWDEETISPMLNSLGMTLSPVENTLVSTSAPTPVQPTPETLALFETMVEGMIHMASSDLTETVIFLEAPSSSPMHGAKIVIQEFSTAPKAYNIHFIAHPEAVALVQPHAASLMSALHGGGYAFKVNRLDLSLSSDERMVQTRKGIVNRGKSAKDKEGEKK